MAQETEIDPVKYGALWQKVENLGTKIDRLESQVDRLLDMANRSKGALWIGIGLWSVVTGLGGFFYGKH